MKTLLCLSLTCLIIKHKVGFELNLFTKQTNINKVFYFFIFYFRYDRICIFSIPFMSLFFIIRLSYQ